MFNLNRRFFQDLLFGNDAAIPHSRRGNGELFDAGLTMGTFIIGRQGSGKTTYLADHLLKSFKKYPKRAVFILDWSGSITNIIFGLIAQEPFEVREKLLRRIIYDELGHPEMVVPMPEFSHLYGSTFDKQVDRVKRNWMNVAQTLVQNASILGGVAFEAVAPALFKVLTSIGEYPSDIWQVTEFQKLIDHPDIWLSTLFRVYKAKIPEATREVLTKRLINVGGKEEELRTYAMNQILAAIQSPYALPRLGYNKPGWTPREAIKNGYMVLVNGQRLIRQDAVQHYLFTQIHSLIMDEVSMRDPSSGGYEPIKIVLDEVLSFLQNPGMGDELSKISTQYRNRKVELYIIAQALWQFNDLMKEAVWNLGNVVCFAVENVNEAEEIGKQLIRYNPRLEKLPPKTSTQNPTTEPSLGQESIYANRIQNLRPRECLIKRFETEQQKDPWISHVRMIPAIGQGNEKESVQAIKDRLLKERGKPIHEIMQTIEGRVLPKDKPKDKPPNGMVQA